MSRLRPLRPTIPYLLGSGVSPSSCPWPPLTFPHDTDVMSPLQAALT